MGGVGSDTAISSEDRLIKHTVYMFKFLFLYILKYIEHLGQHKFPTKWKNVLKMQKKPHRHIYV